LGIIYPWVIGCSAGKDMRMWNVKNYNIAKSNADIHKDIINTLASKYQKIYIYIYIYIIFILHINIS
jgi:hypothetical protein